jgi:hypothetical protein
VVEIYGKFSGTGKDEKYQDWRGEMRQPYSKGGLDNWTLRLDNWALSLYYWTSRLDE